MTFDLDLSDSPTAILVAKHLPGLLPALEQQSALAIQALQAGGGAQDDEDDPEIIGRLWNEALRACDAVFPNEPNRSPCIHTISAHLRIIANLLDFVDELEWPTMEVHVVVEGGTASAAMIKIAKITAILQGWFPDAMYDRAKISAKIANNTILLELASRNVK